MPKPLTTGMPPSLVLYGGYTLELAALDPTTGNAVANVKVSKVVVELDLGADTTPADVAVGPYMLVPGPGA